MSLEITCPGCGDCMPTIAVSSNDLREIDDLKEMAGHPCVCGKCGSILMIEKDGSTSLMDDDSISQLPGDLRDVVARASKAIGNGAGPEILKLINSTKEAKRIRELSQLYGDGLMHLFRLGSALTCLGATRPDFVDENMPKLLAVARKYFEDFEQRCDEGQAAKEGPPGEAFLFAPPKEIIDEIEELGTKILDLAEKIL